MEFPFFFSYQFQPWGCFDWCLFLECFICTEAAKYFLPGYFNLDSDDASCVLRYCISVPEVPTVPFLAFPCVYFSMLLIQIYHVLHKSMLQRNEKGNPRAEAHLTTWVENKAVLVGKSSFNWRNFLNWSLRLI